MKNVHIVDRNERCIEYMIFMVGNAARDGALVSTLNLHQLTMSSSCSELQIEKGG